MKTTLIACLFLIAFAHPEETLATWGPVGSGMNSVVYALTPYDGRLIAGGAFTQAGDHPASRIAAWDGTSWGPVGAGVGSVSFEPRVFALCEYAGDLIVGGCFDVAGGIAVSNIARWDGTTWSPLGSGVDGCVYALAVYQGKLIAGGDFIVAGGSQVNCIAAWDGSSWHGLGDGLECIDCGNDFAVLSLGVHGGDELIAGGWFNRAGGGSANYIARWTGEWTSLGEGMDFPVSALVDFDGDLIAGGAFSNAGGQTATGIARWDGTSWSSLGEGVVGWYNWVRALAVYNGELIAGGYFVEAGGEPANHIARWNGHAWSTLDEGTDGTVASLAVCDARLIAGGAFDHAGDVPAAKIADWDDQPRGACCLHAFCEWLTDTECQAYGGTYEGNATECDPNPCPTSGASEASSLEGRSLDLRVAPNPSTGAVWLRYELPEAAQMAIEIYDASGALVRRLEDGTRPAGLHSAQWDGRDDAEDELPSGIYWIRLSTAKGESSEHVILAR